MKIAYLASRQTLPGAKNRRVDAVEHDYMMSAFRPAFSVDNSTVDDVRWDHESIDWSAYDAALIGTTWDYCDRPDEFLTALQRINTTTPVFNTPDVVRWNRHKSYLRDLQGAGLPLIPTEWIDDPQCVPDWTGLFDGFAAEKLVIKRQIGANAEGQILLSSSDQEPVLSHAVMIQPFMAAIAEEGEYSFIFIDGALSHAVLKRPIEGDYRIQSAYGGSEFAISPDPADIRAARSALEVLEELPLYARVDMVRGNEGNLLLMELELIEPFLYPLQGPNFGHLVHASLKNRLTI